MTNGVRSHAHGILIPRSGRLRVPASVAEKRDFSIKREEAENIFRAVLMHQIAMNLSDRQR